MGACQVRVTNETDQPIYIVTYNDVDTVYWVYRDARQLPAGGEPVTVTGIEGGSAVKVAVIYSSFVDGKQYVADMFRIATNGYLRIQELNAHTGVTSYSGYKSNMIERGKVLNLSWASRLRR